MSGFSPLTASQLKQIFAEAFNAAPGVLPIYDGPGSSLGPFEDALSNLALMVQQGQNYAQQISRLYSIPPNKDGTPNPDVDSFVYPFGFTRLAAQASSGQVTFSTPSPVASQLVIPIGTIVSTENGLQFLVIVDQSNAAYSASAGGYPSGGYILAVGQRSVNVTVQCLSTGVIGNVQPGLINSIFGGGVAGFQTVSNAQAFSNGRDVETDAALKARFTLGMSSGRVATINALASALLAVQSNLTYSIGDMLNASGTGAAPQTTTTANVTIPAQNATVSVPVTSGPALPLMSYVLVSDGNQIFYGQITAISSNTYTVKNLLSVRAGSGTVASGATVLFVGGQGFVTVVVNQIGQNTPPTTTLVSAVQAALSNVRGAGITVTAIAPTIDSVNCVASIKLAAGADWNTVNTACQAAFDNYVNNIGLDPAGATTTCSLARVYAALINVPGVADVLPGLTLNGSAQDVSAGFAQQLVAGTATFTSA